MSDAETSAYLLMAGGLIWIMVGIVGLVRLSRKRREEMTSEQVEIRQEE